MSKNQYILVYLCSWLTHNKSSLECQLLSSLLLEVDKQKIKIYLRLRKYIVQLANISMLDEIVLKHEDVITIVHRMFPTSIRREIVNGIKKIFISFKVSNAKIYASVFIEYILSVYDSAEQQQQSIMAGQNTNITSNIIAFSDFSSIINFNSNLHQQNGLANSNQRSKYKPGEYSIIQTKFIPQRIEIRKSRLSCEDNQNYSYHNSINYNEEKGRHSISRSKNSSQKQNKIQNQKSPTLNSNFGSGMEIKIEDYQSIKQKSHYEQNYCSKQSQNQFNQLVCRNQMFKNRILSNSHLKSNLSVKEQESINDTINIIHNSIVRNHRYHLG